eukprot:768375-Hanusia_phi.AAC.9
MKPTDFTRDTHIDYPTTICYQDVGGGWGLKGRIEWMERVLLENPDSSLQTPTVQIMTQPPPLQCLAKLCSNGVLSTYVFTTDSSPALPERSTQPSFQPTSTPTHPHI